MAVLKYIGDTLGLTPVLKSPWDVHCLIWMRFFRLMAFGQISVILAQFFDAHGFSQDKTGLFMSLTLAGDVGLSLFLTTYGDRLGRKNVLLIGAGLMTLSGLVFFHESNYYLLLLAAICGVISPSGAEVGPFRAIEESTLAQLTTLEARPDVFAWYTLLGSLGAALGALIGGWTVQLAQERYHFTKLEAYKTVFLTYAVIGFIKFIASLFLSVKVEAPADETEPLLANDQENATQEQAEVRNNIKRRGGLAKLLPNISPESQKIITTLCLLFAIDSMGSSLANFSWISYYIQRKFDISTGFLGSVFFTTGIVAALATLVGSGISRRLGPLLTMVVTHLPSSALICLLPVPSTVRGIITILAIRACTAQMDVAPRQAFLSAVVLKNERTLVMGWVGTVKTLAQLPGPYITGYLARHDKQWIAFVAAGSLKVIYDLSILSYFTKVKLDRDQN